MVYDNKIPIDAETCKALDIFDIVPTTAALNGGEDYELLFTIGQKDYEKLKDCPEIHIIGHIVEAAQGCYMVPENGPMMRLEAQGFDGFKQR